MEKPYFADNLSERQAEVIMHYVSVLGSKLEDIHYIKTEEYLSDIYPVDIVVFEPVENFDYYTVATVGLSSYRFEENFARSNCFI